MIDDEGGTEFHPRTVLPKPQAFVLTFLEGPEEHAPVTLSQAMHVLVGQSPACEVRLADPRVSRRHVALQVEGDTLEVIDQRSTNGTFVNGVSIAHAHLHGGELVTIGATRFRVTREVAFANDALSEATMFGRTFGSSPEMRRLHPLCERLAGSDVPLVIEGETGTGKEVLAESIHDMGPRANAPFVVFDCTAVPANLMESELFGHEKGAFTGAGALRKGMFEQAHGGTLLIDEIGDLELTLQPKLLRAVERREIRRIGGDRSIKVDVRVISATRRDLDREVQAGRFRDDLFHRLAVTRIELPPLRKRKGDIRALAEHFFREFAATPPPDLIARWEDELWPGNVRELRNAVARWVAIGELGTELRAGSKSDAKAMDASSDFIEHVLELRLPLTESRERVVESFERRYIDRLLAAHDGNVGRAATAAGIGRRYLQMLLARRT